MQELPDSQLVELAQAGDEQAFAELASRYFGPVYDFAARLTRDRDDADAITAATFEDAMYDLGGLHDGANFRSWLFTIARNAALDCLGHGPRQRPLTFEPALAPDPVFDNVEPVLFPDIPVRVEAVALAPLVWEAAAALDPRQLSLLDLQLRHGLDSQEIALVAGVTLTNCDVMLARLYSAADDAMGAFIMANHGRPACDKLRTCLSGSPFSRTPMSPEARGLVDHHVAECEVCAEQERRRLPPLTIFAALTPVLPPAGTEQSLLAGLLARWPGATGLFVPVIGGSPMRGGTLDGLPAAVAGALPPAGGGFARAVGAAQRSPHVLRAFAGLGAAAVLLVAFLVVPSSPIALTQFHGGLATPGTNATSDPGGQTAGQAPGPTALVVIPVTATPTATGTPTTVPATPSSISSTSSAQVGVAPTATPTLPPSATPTPPPTIPPTTVPPTATPTRLPTQGPPTPTPVATPCTAVLTPNINTVNASAGNSSFEILNGSACVSGAYAVNVGTASQGWLKVSPGAGALAPFRGDTITVTADLSVIPDGAAGLITVIWPGGQFTVSVTVSTAG